MDYYRISAQKLGEGSKIPIVKLNETGEVYYELALEMTRIIEANNAAHKRTVMIVPVGPTGHYSIFVRLVEQNRISLKDCWFINMDEYLADGDEWMPLDNPLSFRRFMNEEVYSRISEELLMPVSQKIFPDPHDLGRIPSLITELGGVDLCIAGMGINGHVAFNEPEPELTPEEFAKLKTRIVDISPQSRTTNAVSALGGALDAMPKRCVTIGMWEILSSRIIRFGCFRNWHSGALRKAAYGDVSSGFPGTLLQRHPNALIYASGNAVKQPF